jgi:hypothetical protein
VQDEAARLRQPPLHRLAVVDADGVTDQMHGGDGGRHQRIQVRQEAEELGLPLAPAQLARHRAGPRIEGGEEVERAAAPILMLPLQRSVGASGTGRHRAWPWVELGDVINGEHDFRREQGTGREVGDRADLRQEPGITWPAGMQPEVTPPGTQAMAAPQARDGRGRNGGDHAIGDAPAGPFRAVRLAERRSGLIGDGAGEVDRLEFDVRGTTPGPAGPRHILETGEALGAEAVEPVAHGGAADADQGTDVAEGGAIGRAEHDACRSRAARRKRGAAREAEQLRPRVITQLRNARARRAGHDGHLLQQRAGVQHARHTSVSQSGHSFATSGTQYLYCVSIHNTLFIETMIHSGTWIVLVEKL